MLSRRRDLAMSQHLIRSGGGLRRQPHKRFSFSPGGIYGRTSGYEEDDGEYVESDGYIGGVRPF